MNNKIESFILSDDDAKKILNSSNPIDSDTKKQIVDLLIYLLDNNKSDIEKWDNIDLKNDILELFNNHSIDSINSTFAYDVLRRFYSAIRENIAPLIFADNLNILLSNGCSIVSGSKSINDEINDELSSILQSFRSRSTILQDKVQNLNNLSPEKVLDKLYQIKSYFENILEDSSSTSKTESIINKYQEVLLKSYVLGIDYSKTDTHKNFLMKLMGIRNRKTTLFTLNYDLLIERACEELNITLNNGFSGFHLRKFNPSNFNYQNYVETSKNEKLSTKSLNLVKLHGSLSWQYSEDEPIYNIVEKQIEVDEDYKIKFENITNEAIIYPVQTKKSHSLDLPYSEMFRQFNESLNQKNTVLIVIGYSFLDEHVNDLLNSALSNPYFSLIIFSYSSLEEIESNQDSELYKFYVKAKTDKRISIFTGKLLGNFATVTNDIIPSEPPKDILRELESIIKQNRN